MRSVGLVAVSLIVTGLVVSLLVICQDLLKTREERDQALLERDQYRNQSEVWRKQSNELFEDIMEWGRLEQRLAELYGVKHWVDVVYDENNITRRPWYLTFAGLVDLMEEGHAAIIINRTDWRVSGVLNVTFVQSS